MLLTLYRIYEDHYAYMRIVIILSPLTRRILSTVARSVMRHGISIMQTRRLGIATSKLEVSLTLLRTSKTRTLWPSTQRLAHPMFAPAVLFVNNSRRIGFWASKTFAHHLVIRN